MVIEDCLEPDHMPVDIHGFLVATHSLLTVHWQRRVVTMTTTELDATASMQATDSLSSHASLEPRIPGALEGLLRV